MMKKVILVFLFFGFYNLYASDIFGVVKDRSSGKPLPAVNVVLKSVRDSSKAIVEKTNAEGRFIFKDTPKSYRIISIKFLTYEDYYRLIDSAGNLGIINLIPKDISTREVIVEDQVPMAQMKGDTLQFDSRAFKTNPDATAEDLMRKMPGVTSEDGSLKAQGERVQRVLVDGKPFFGDDPNAAVKNLPAEIISKIEIFDEQSEQSKFTGFDDGNTIKTVNFITNEQFRDGTFGDLYAGYGDQDHYRVGGVVNYFNEDRRVTFLAQSNDINIQNFSTEDLAGVQASANSFGPGRGSGGGGGRPGGGRPGRPGSSIGGDINDFLVDQVGGISSTNSAGVNYTDKLFEKVELTTSYFFNENDNVEDSDILQQFVVGLDSGTVYRENDLSHANNINHRVNLRANYKINETNELLILPKFSAQDYFGESYLSAETSLRDNLINTSQNDITSNLLATRFENDLIYRHRFEKRGRSLVAHLGNKLIANDGESHQYSENQFSRDTNSNIIDQFSDYTQSQNDISGMFMFTEGLSRTSMLMLNYRFENSNNTSDNSTFDFNSDTDEYDMLNPLLSNVFESNYFKNEIGTGIRFFNFRSGFMMMVRAAFEWSELSAIGEFPQEYDLSREFNNIIPGMFLRYKINDASNLRFGYRTNTSQPTVSQLQNVLNNSNPLQLSIGNPNLDQQFNHRLFLRYQSTNTEVGSVFYAMITGSAINDYVGNATYIAASDTSIDNIMLREGMQLTRPENMSGYYNVSSFANYGFPVNFIYSNLNFNAGISYSRIPGILNGMQNFSNTPSGNFGIVLSSNISEKIDFTISSTSAYTVSENTVNDNLNQSFFSQLSELRFYWNIFNGFVLRSNLSNQFYSGLTDDFNQSFTIWNVSLGYKFMKNDRAELVLSVNDILKENTNISRTATETYIQDARTNVLQRYAMLTLTYDIRHFPN